MELFTATVKLKKSCFTTRDFRCVYHGWHGTHRYDIQVLAPPPTHTHTPHTHTPHTHTHTHTHTQTLTSTWVHRYSSLLQWSVPLGQRGHVAMLGRNARCTVSHKRHDFRKKLLLNIKCVFWFYVQLSCETFLILRRTERDMIKKMHICLLYKITVAIVRFQHNLNFNITWISI